MSANTNTFESIKAVLLSAHKHCSSTDKVKFYDTWAETYDQDVAVLDYRAPSLAANCIASHFSGERETSVVLDVACGTGLMAKQMRKHGFRCFVGVDGSEAMLDKARESGLYQDLKHLVLDKDPLPTQFAGSFDVVVVVGAMCAGHISFNVARDLFNAIKPGGCICLTTRSNPENLEYKASLDLELKKIEEEGLGTCLEVIEVEDWERGVLEHDGGYISGVVYLYKRI
ncbi:methyltransferase-like protein 27 [Kryptolebias marmoratus]|uniref:Methyltransferase like 27 n=1 Tax=Kryptolebias marmoratus TaxID=37003 RepID=A0A3Q3B839_KRYMA|nr:methyltransferase-like protein 27 [Kryptolebias marmoratus]